MRLIITNSEQGVFSPLAGVSSLSGTRSATVRAKTEMKVLLIPYNRFDQVMDENPAMVKGIARELARRLRAMDETVSR